MTTKTDRRTWSIMLAGLWAGVFRNTSNHEALTRWADLQEEIQEI